MSRKMLQRLLRGADVVRQVLVRHRWILFLLFFVYAIGMCWVAGVALGALSILRHLVHEGGHYFAGRLCGARMVGIAFFPFPPAGITLPYRDFPTRLKEAVFFLAGPAAGITFTAIYFALWVITQEDVVLAATMISVLDEAVPLLPINPLDGGWFLKCLSFSLSRRCGRRFILLSNIQCIVIAGVLVWWGNGGNALFFLSCCFAFSVAEGFLYATGDAEKKSGWEALIGVGEPIIATDTEKEPMSRSAMFAFFGVYCLLIGVLLSLGIMVSSEEKVGEALDRFLSPESEG